MTKHLQTDKFRRRRRRNADLRVAALPSHRTSKASGKLKILPEEPEGDAVTPIRPSKFKESNDSQDSSDDDDDDDEDDDNVDPAAKRDRANREEVYKRLQHIPEGSMRRDARRLTRKGRASLPRVTAYSTAT